MRAAGVVNENVDAAEPAKARRSFWLEPTKTASLIVRIRSFT
jgi:GH35 family endo-1,4-beta-xylanase